MTHLPDVPAEYETQIYFAGHDTQKGKFSLLLNTLDRKRDALAWLAEDTRRIEGAAPELYRYDATGQFMGRTATADVELGGHIIREGQTVTVSMAAANRDPEVFDAPDELPIRWR